MTGIISAIRTRWFRAFRTRYRIVTYRDYEGVTWYRPQRSRGLMKAWGDSDLGVSFLSRDKAVKMIEDWRRDEKRRSYREQVLEVVVYD